MQAKYYPPDFDPSKLPRAKKKRPNDDAVRFMLPMSVRCETCGEFMGTGLKFNARKSDTNENYLGIRIFRFSMKCKSCPAAFTIRTDPQNSDYVCESGARRNYEPWREKQKADDESKQERTRQDEDKMQALENKTKDAKKEMDDLDNLADIKSGNAKRAALSVDEVLRRGRAREEAHEKATERQLLAQAKAVFEKKKEVQPDSHSTGQKSQLSYLPETPPKTVLLTNSILPKLKIRKKIKKPVPPEKKVPKPTVSLVNYADSSSDSE